MTANKECQLYTFGIQKILYVIEIGVNLHCAVFVLKEKEEGRQMMTEEEVVEKKATTTKNNREQSKFQKKD